MRILVVMNLYPPHHFGGYEDLCAGAVAAWRGAGHEVVVLASDYHRDDVAPDAPAPGGDEVIRALPIYWDHHVLRPRLLTARRWEQRSRAVVAATLAEVGPDVISIWNPGGLSMGALGVVAAARLPTVLVIGDRWLELGPHADGWASRFLGRERLATVVGAVTGLDPRLRSLGRQVVACFASEHLRAHAAATTTWSFAATPIVPHGVDLVAHPPAPVSPEVTPWGGRLLSVGRITYDKGIDTAVDAVALTPRATRLDVVGAGDPVHAAKLDRRVAWRGVTDRVRFLGEVRGPALRAAYEAADALVFPSRWEEPFGIVPLEAMAAGTPVIATGTGGSGEFLLDGTTALRFPIGDATALAGAIDRLAGDEALRGRLRANGLEVAGWLDRERTYEELLAWHEAVRGGLVGPLPPERGVLPPALVGHD